MTSGATLSGGGEERLRWQVSSSVQDLVYLYHVASAPSVVQRGQIEHLKSPSVGEVADVWYQFRRASLNVLHELFVSLVERTPDHAAVLQVRTDEGFIQKRKGVLVNFGK